MRTVGVVVRLLLDRQGRLVQGEALDLDGNRYGRFVDWPGLSSVLRMHWPDGDSPARVG